MTSSRPQAGRWLGALAGIVVGMWMLCVTGGAAHAASSYGSASFTPSATDPVGWRGDGTGRYPGATPPTEWYGSTAGPNTNVGWITQLPMYHGGSAASAPIVVGDKLYTQIGSKCSGTGPVDLACVDTASGQILWISPVTAWHSASAAHKAQASGMGVDALLADLSSQTDQLVTTLNDGTLNQNDWQNNICGQRHTTGGQIAAIMQSIDADLYATHDRHDWGYASSTPCSDGQHIYTYFSNRAVTCFDLDGTIVWSSIYPAAIRPTQEHGSHASPLLLPDKMIALYGTLMMAFDKSTGQLIWEREFIDKWGICSSSPVAVELSDGFALMPAHGQGISAADGTTLWGPIDGYQGENTTPVAVDGILYSWERTGTRTFTIPTSLAGGGELIAGPEKRPASMWDEYQIASPLAHDGYVYCISNIGLMHVLSMAAEDEMYTQTILFGEYGWVGEPGLCPSPALVGDCIYALDGVGTMVIFAQGDTYQEHAKNTMAFDDMFVTNPVFHGSRIFLRGQAALYCVDGNPPVDSDGDGLTDALEDSIGTDPFDTDTDGDGMPDDWEYHNGLDPLVDDAGTDADSDGLFNIDEYTAGTDPHDDDSDNDGMPDGWELDHGLNPAVDDADADADGDGMTNIQEYIAGSDPQATDPDTDGDGLNDPLEALVGTNPAVPDSDSDGMPDGWEYDAGLDPLTDDSGADFDTDGLTNLEELVAGTDPADNDTDNDGMPDGWELDYGLDPLTDDASGDPDADGRGNGGEFLAGTDPFVADAATAGSSSTVMSCGAPADATQMMGLAILLLVVLRSARNRNRPARDCR